MKYANFKPVPYASGTCTPKAGKNEKNFLNGSSYIFASPKNFQLYPILEQSCLWHCFEQILKICIFKKYENFEFYL